MDIIAVTGVFIGIAVMGFGFIAFIGKGIGVYAFLILEAIGFVILAALPTLHAIQSARLSMQEEFVEKTLQTIDNPVLDKEIGRLNVETNRDTLYSHKTDVFGMWLICKERMKRYETWFPQQYFMPRNMDIFHRLKCFAVEIKPTNAELFDFLEGNPLILLFDTNSAKIIGYMSCFRDWRDFLEYIPTLESLGVFNIESVQKLKLNLMERMAQANISITPQGLVGQQPSSPLPTEEKKKK